MCACLPCCLRLCFDRCHPWHAVPPYSLLWLEPLVFLRRHQVSCASGHPPKQAGCVICPFRGLSYTNTRMSSPRTGSHQHALRTSDPMRPYSVFSIVRSEAYSTFPRKPPTPLICPAAASQPLSSMTSVSCDSIMQNIPLSMCRGESFLSSGISLDAKIKQYERVFRIWFRPCSKNRPDDRTRSPDGFRTPQAYSTEY